MNTGWEVKPLGEILSVIRNGISRKQLKGAHGSPVSRIETIASGSVDEEKVGTLDLTDAEKNKYRLESGDILFSHINSPAHVGKTALFDGASELYHGMNLMLLRTIPAVDAKYLENYLQSLRSRGYWARTAKQSVNQASVNQRDIKKVAIPLPPLEEQRRIVAVLDEAFEGLARARENTEANLASAREVFKTSLSDALNKAATDWEIVPVGDAFTTSTGSTPPKSQKELYGDAVSFVKPPELLNQEIGETADGLSKKGEQVARIAPAGSLLVSCIGILGKVGLAATDVAFNQQINSIQPNRSKALPEFMFYQVYSSAFRQQLEALAGGTTVPIVNKSRFNSIKIALPPLDVQRDLVSRFQKLDQETKELQEAYRCKLQDLDELRQTLLQKAFAGELT
ncbi:MAG: restriction endonuclease subunit S [Henriciella sp.]|uniref:restriction endonuclease subunit S n=1 Tax=Henriciella sp. TaxID=1968823 RepID=UPI0032EAE208